MCAAIGLLLLCAGCRLDMHVEPRYDPYAATDFFGDGQSARVPVAGTVPREDLSWGPRELLDTGKIDGKPADVFPFPVTRDVLERGRDRFNIYCTPCHGLSGEGDGMIVQRGFPRPPSYHIDRLRTASAGHFFDVITNGLGMMYPYGYRVPSPDRWAIISYIRALQLSRQVPFNELSEAEQKRLKGQ
jgi:mono/diheme cytochrome c family protein